MEARLREWRQEAVKKHQYHTAICVADKLLAITGASPPSKQTNKHGARHACTTARHG